MLSVYMKLTTDAHKEAIVKKHEDTLHYFRIISSSLQCFRCIISKGSMENSVPWLLKCERKHYGYGGPAKPWKAVYFVQDFDENEWGLDGEALDVNM